MMQEAYVLSRAQKLYVVCAAVFITALVVAEATASKFFTAFDLPFTIRILGQQFTTVVMTAGVIAFPITFIVTDLMNEYFGRRGIAFVSLLGMVMIGFEFVLLQIAMGVPTAPNSPVTAEAFDMVFGATGRIIFGSLIAYFIGQLADITIFHYLRRATEGRHLWLRATGSTFGSQFLDTFIVLTVAFAGLLSFQEILAITLFNYSYKFIIAILITPVIYAIHWVMDLYLGRETAQALIDEAEGKERKSGFDMGI
ncbi:MAG: queuosine precursor transporter [Rhodothermales bacterium]|nr:queuosine precursor transporter [Rhodothermales bacterium]